MNTYKMALFGEAEKGDYDTPYFCESLPQLIDILGNPPLHSRGLFYAIQALLFRRQLIFFRVREEGFSQHDYFAGLQILSKDPLIIPVAALCLPGVGDTAIIQAALPLCLHNHSILITTESDFYDYLTNDRRLLA